MVDIAYTPQINEYRGLRTVQLNLLDIRPDEQARARLGAGKALYRRHLQGAGAERAGARPADPRAAGLCRSLAVSGGKRTERRRLRGVWLPRAQNHALRGLTYSGSKIRVCLDVFQEQGLLQMEQRPKLLVIRLTSDGHKVDLESSPTLLHLKELKAGT